MATETFNLIGADGEAAPAPPPQKFLPKREEFADLANDRARLRVAETQQLLFHSVKTGNEAELVRILDMDPTADINCKNSSGATLLHIAAAQGQPSILSLLLQRGALLDVHSNRESGSLTPLHHATINGHIKATELILERGADPDAVDHDGMTCLHHMARRGNKQMAHLLISNGANSEKRDKEGKSPAYLARLFDNKDLVAMLPDDSKYDYVSFLCDQIENDPMIAANRILFASKKGKKGGKKGGKKKKK